MAKLFKLPEKGEDTVAGFAVPADESSGTISVVDDYPWASNDPRNAAREDVPRIRMTEYQITSGQLQASAYYWLKGIADGWQALQDKASPLTGKTSVTYNPYDGLYLADPTGFVYEFPYFNGYNHEINNQWSDEHALSKAWNNIKSVIRESPVNFQGFRTAAAVAAGVGGLVESFITPSFGAESPKTWAGGSDSAYTVQFDLLNTLRSSDIDRNWQLCFLLGYQTMHWRRNLLMSYPPCIYEVDIPGIRYSPAAVIAGLTIEDLGNKRLIGEGDKRFSYPDAYRVTIKVQELIEESRNIYKGVYDGSKVKAISKSSALADEFKELADGLLETGKGAYESTKDNLVAGASWVGDQAKKYFGVGG